MRWSSVRALLVLFSLCATSTSGCGDDGDTPSELCDAASLEAALESAAAGDVVTLGACDIDGSFTVPAGVELRGAGASSSTIHAAEGAAVTLGTGTGTTRLADLSVTSDGDAAIVAQGTGAGAIELADLQVDATLGIGIGVEDVASLSIDGVEATGPVDPSNAESLEPPWVPDEVATVGLAVFRVPTVTVATSSVTGFASAAVVLVESGTSWTGGEVRQNLGVGLMVSAGTATLSNLAITDTLAGAGLYPAYGAVCARGASLTTSGLSVSNTEGPGVLHDDCDADHTDLTSEDNERAGAWAQNAGTFRLTGSSSQIVRNGLAGIWIAAVDAVEIAGVQVADTLLVPTIPDGQASPVDMGDGLLIRDTTGSVTLTDLTISNNGRAGILIDLGGGSSAGYTFDSVSVDGTGDQLGCIGQNGELLEGWAAGVERLGATAVNDAAVVDPLGVTGIVQPQDLPPAADDLASLLE